MTSGVERGKEEIEDLKRRILEYFRKTPGGTFAGACKYAGAAYSTAYVWRKVDQEFDEDVIAARAVADDLGGDFAESKLMEAINNNELTGIIFYLKTKHKHRGYIERTDIVQETLNRHIMMSPAEEDQEILDAVEGRALVHDAAE